MAKIVFENGITVDFDGNPSQDDIEEVAASFSEQTPPAQGQQGATPSPAAPPLSKPVDPYGMEGQFEDMKEPGMVEQVQQTITQVLPKSPARMIPRTEEMLGKTIKSMPGSDMNGVAVPPDPYSAMGYAFGNAPEAGKQMEQEASQVLEHPSMKIPERTLEGYIPRTVSGGIESWGPQMATMPLAAAGKAATMLGVGLFYGLPQYQDTYDEAKKAGVSEGRARAIAIADGIAQGGIESIGNLYEMTLAGMFNKGPSDIAKQWAKDGVKGAVKRLIKIYAAELGEEESQNIISKVLRDTASEGKMKSQSWGQTVTDPIVSTAIGVLPFVGVGAINTRSAIQNTPKENQDIISGIASEFTIDTNAKQRLDKLPVEVIKANKERVAGSLNLSPQQLDMYLSGREGGTANAESTGTQINEGSGQEGNVQGTEGGIRIRDNAAPGMEATQGTWQGQVIKSAEESAQVFEDQNRERMVAQTPKGREGLRQQLAAEELIAPIFTFINNPNNRATIDALKKAYGITNDNQLVSILSAQRFMNTPETSPEVEQARKEMKRVWDVDARNPEEKIAPKEEPLDFNTFIATGEGRKKVIEAIESSELPYQQKRQIIDSLPQIGSPITLERSQPERFDMAAVNKSLQQAPESKINEQDNLPSEGRVKQEIPINVPVSDESRYFGTRVTVRPQYKGEIPYTGTVKRILNNGDLIEVVPDKFKGDNIVDSTSFRVDRDKVTFDEIKDNGEIKKAESVSIEKQKKETRPKSIIEIADEIAKTGADPQASYGLFVKERGLKPEISAKEWLPIYKQSLLLAKTTPSPPPVASDKAGSVSEVSGEEKKQANEITKDKIYQVNVKVGNNIESKFAVPRPERYGYKNGFGDSLWDTRREAEAELERQNQEEKNHAEYLNNLKKEEIKKEEEKKQKENIDGFGSDLTPMQKGKVISFLNKKMRFDGKDIMSIKDKVKELVESGAELEIKQENAIKPMSRRQYNRATQREQDEHERKVKEAGKKNVYYIGGYDLGKTAYDYASYLKNKKYPSPPPAAVTTEATGSTGVKEGVKKQEKNQRSLKEFNRLIPTDRQEYLRTRVSGLGDIKTVQEVYSNNTIEDEYANAIAKEIYKKISDKAEISYLAPSGNRKNITVEDRTYIQLPKDLRNKVDFYLDSYRKSEPDLYEKYRKIKEESAPITIITTEENGNKVSEISTEDNFNDTVIRIAKRPNTEDLKTNSIADEILNKDKKRIEEEQIKKQEEENKRIAQEEIEQKKRNDFENEVNKIILPKGERKNITINLYNEIKDEYQATQIPATVYGNFAVFKDDKAKDNKKYNITHVPSGLNAGYSGSQKKALDIIKALNLPEFDFSEKTITKETAQKAGEVLRYYLFDGETPSFYKGKDQSTEPSKAQPGLAFVKDQQRYFTASRPITRGKKKGMVELTLPDGKKAYVKPDAIIRKPEGETRYSKTKNRESFYVTVGNKNIEIIKNPTDTDYQILKKEVRDIYPNMPKGEPTTRFTHDKNGNRYIWKAHEGTHSLVEELITKKTGEQVSQNNYYSKGKPSTGISLTDAQKSLSRLTRTLEGTGTTLNIRDTAPPDIGNGNIARASITDHKDGTFTIDVYTKAFDSTDDMLRTVAGEVTHGSMKMLPDNAYKRNFMRDLYRHLEKTGGEEWQTVKNDYADQFDKATSEGRMALAEEWLSHKADNQQFYDYVQGIKSANPSLWQRFKQMVVNFLRRIGVYSKISDADINDILSRGREAWEGRGKEDRGFIGNMLPDTLYAAVWHGTPHTWQPEPGFPHGRMRLDKIGSGEGAAAYGYGAYLGEAEEVGEKYRLSLTNRRLPNSLTERMYNILVDGKSIKGKYDIEADKTFVDLIANNNFFNAMIYALNRKKRWDELSKDKTYKHNDYAKDKAKAWGDLIPKIKKGSISSSEKGSLYKLDIPDDVLPKLLDWDKPLSEQSEYVKERIDKDINEWVGEDYENKNNLTGRQIYNRIGVVKATKNNRGNKAASEYLNSLGIPGTKYLDQMSRYNKYEVHYGNKNNDISNFTSEKEALAEVEDLKKNGYPNAFMREASLTSNYVIWDQPTLDRIALLERNGEKLDAIREADQNQFAVDTKFSLKNAVKRMPEKTDIAYSEIDNEPEKNLMVVHNITASKLLHADKLGGIALPSVAVVNKNKGIEGFGDITLILPLDYANPKTNKNVKFFDADIYSPRYPEQKRVINQKAFKLYYDKAVNDFLKDVKDTEDYEYKNIKENNTKNWNNTDRALNRIDEKSNSLEYDIIANYEFLKTNEIKFDGTIQGIRDTISKNRDVYDEYINKKLDDFTEKSRFFKGFSNTTGKKLYSDYTLENIAREMKKELRGGEGFSYGAGNVRAQLAKKYSSLSQIKKDENRLVNKDEFEQTKEEMNDELSAIALDAAEKSNYDRRSFSSIDNFINNLIEGIKRKNIRSELTEYGFHNTDFDRLYKFLDKLKNLPTEYFEGKFQIPVNLNSFVGAIIPNDSSSVLKNTLKKHGIEFIEYDKNIKGDRGKKLSEFEHEKDIRFSKGQSTGSTKAEKLSSFLTRKAKNLATKIEVVQSQKDLPEYLQKDTVIEGVTDRGTDTIYIVADNVNFDRGVTVALRHEMMHAGIKRVLGDKYSDTMKQVGQVLGMGEVSDARAEEAMGLLSEVKDSRARMLWNRIVRMFNEFVRKLGFNRTMSKAEVKGIIEQSISAGKRGERSAIGQLAEDVNSFAQDVKYSLKQAAKKITANPNFVKWFGNSKVVDENGEPLVVYHGTTKDIKSFDINKSGENIYEATGGLFFTNDTGEASDYAAGGSFFNPTGFGGNVLPVYLSIKNPFVEEIDNGFKNSEPALYLDEYSYKIENAKNNGHDGIIIKNTDTGQTLFVAFSPTQIKSVYNQGTFDESNPDIRYSIGKQQETTEQFTNIDDWEKWVKNEENKTQTKNIVDASKELLKNKKAQKALNLKAKDISRIEQAASLPSWMSQKDENYRNIVKIQHKATGRTNNLIEDFLSNPDNNEETHPFIKLNSKSAAKVTEQWIRGDKEEHWLSDTELKNAGLNKEEIAAYNAIKKTMNKAWHVKVKSLEDFMYLPYRDKSWFPELKAVANNEITIEQATKNLELKDKRDFQKAHDTISGEITTLRELRSKIGNIEGYFPRGRDRGDWEVSVYTMVENENGEMIKTKIHYERTTPSLFQNKEKKQAEEIYYRLKKEFPNYIVEEPVEKPVTTEEMYQDITNSAVEKFIEIALNKAETTGKIDEADTEALRKSVFQAVKDELSARGWGAHQIKRTRSKYITGFKTKDGQRIFSDYLTGMAGGITKSEKAYDMMQELNKIDKDKKRTIDEARSYVKEMLRNQNVLDRMAGKAKAAVYLMYIAGKISMVPLQFTQNFVTGIPLLQRQAKELGIKGSRQGDRIYTKAMFDFATSRLSEDEKKVLEKAKNDGEIDDAFTKEATGSIDSAFGRKMKKTMKGLSFFMSIMEKFNRSSALLARYRAGIKAGEDSETAYKNAVDFIWKTHFLMGKANRPAWTRGGTFGSSVASSAYALKSFQHNYILLLINSLKNKEGKIALDVVGNSMAYTLLFGGLAAAPFYDYLLDMLEKATGIPYRANLRKLMNTIGGDILEKLSINGLPALFGISMSRSMQPFGLPSLNDLTTMGAVTGIMDKGDKAFNQIISGNYLDGIISALPIFLERPAKSIQGMTEGLKNKYGKVYKTQSGDKMKLTPSEALLYAGALMPERINREFEVKRSLSNAENANKNSKGNSYYYGSSSSSMGGFKGLKGMKGLSRSLSR